MNTPNIALLWTDIETTGLDYEEDLILEVSWQITDFLGEPITEVQSSLTIPFDDDTTTLSTVLDKYLAAPNVVKQMHLDNGLWADLFFNQVANRGSIYKVIDDIQSDLDTVRTPTTEVRLAGSSVHFDKRFLETVVGGELGISHRVFDLSTIRPFMAWQDIDINDFAAGLPTDSHRAHADVTRDVATWRGLVEAMRAEV